MTPEQLALERYLTELYRDAPSVVRLAEQAGMDASHLPIGTPIRANLWHEVIAQAIAEDKLGSLVAVTLGERAPAMGGKIQELYDAYLEAREPAPQGEQRPRQSPPRGQDGDRLSDYRMDERRDARIDQMQVDLFNLRVQVAGLVVQVAELKGLMEKQAAHEAPSLSNRQFVAIMIAFAVLAALVFAAVYYGGNR
jgi:hypothetical protein